MNKQMVTLVAFSVAVGSIGVGSSCGQAPIDAIPAGVAGGYPSQQPDSATSSLKNFIAPTKGDYVAIGPIRGEIKELTQQLHQTNNETAKADLIKRLEAAVGKYFDQDLKIREGQLSKLEERVATLRGQLERRRKAKTEITQLQTKLLANDAEGLGFSGSSLLEIYNPMPENVYSTEVAPAPQSIDANPFPSGPPVPPVPPVSAR